MKLSRRGLFGLFAGAAAAPLLAKVLPAPPPAGEPTLAMYEFAERYLKPAVVHLFNQIDTLAVGDVFSIGGG